MNNNIRHFDVSVPDNVIKIIGIEFTVTTMNGYNQELGMFTPNLLIARARTKSPYGSGQAYQPKITFHTTDGDFTIQDDNWRCPW